MKLATAILAGSACVSSVPAAAQTAMSGFYVGGGFGQSKAKDWCGGDGFDSCDDKDKAWKIFGGYQITRNIAAEIGYSRLGKFTASFTDAVLGRLTDEAKVAAWEASALLGAPLVDRLGIFGRLGVYRGTVKETTDFAGDFSHDNTNFTFGLGLSYDIIPQLAVRGEWQRYYQVGGGETALGAGVGQKSDVDVLGISALWRF